MVCWLDLLVGYFGSLWNNVRGLLTGIRSVFEVSGCTLHWPHLVYIDVSIVFDVEDAMKWQTEDRMREGNIDDVAALYHM